VLDLRVENNRPVKGRVFSVAITPLSQPMTNDVSSPGGLKPSTSGAFLCYQTISTACCPSRSVAKKKKMDCDSPPAPDDALKFIVGAIMVSSADQNF
jgi:hypothetical protein